MKKPMKVRPWHFWLVAAFFLFLYGMGIYDFIMIHSGSAEEYILEKFEPPAVAYFANYPILPLFFWAANLAAGVAAPLFLLLRQRIAVWLALVSAISDLVLMFITFTFMNRWNAIGAGNSAFDIGIAILTFAEFAYCKWYFRRKT